MKYKLLLLFMATALTFSCSSDDNNGTPTEDSLVGTWDFTEFRIDEATTDSDLIFAKGIADVLLAQGCDIFTFVFNDDNTVVGEFRNFDEADVDFGSGTTGLTLVCPETKETETSTWSLEGNQLTFINVDGMNETVTIQLAGDTLIIPAEILDSEDLSDGEVVFTRR